MTTIIVGAARLAARVTATFAVAFTIGTLGHQLPAHAGTRPWWDGRHPHVWTAEADPMCWRSILGRHGWIQAGQHGPRFRAVCARDGQAFAWDVTGSAR